MIKNRCRYCGSNVDGIKICTCNKVLFDKKIWTSKNIRSKEWRKK
jgi:hypothetical protein